MIKVLQMVHAVARQFGYDSFVVEGVDLERHIIFYERTMGYSLVRGGSGGNRSYYFLL